MIKKIFAILICFAALPLGSAASANLITNSGFETVSGGFPSGWGNRYPSNITCNSASANVHSGTKSLRFSTQTSNLPYATQTLRNLEEGAAYSYSMYVKTENAGCFIAFKFEWYDAADNNLAQSGSDAVSADTQGEWTCLSGTEIAPEGAYAVVIYVRMYGTGTAYVDDVTFQYESDPAKFLSLKTDDVFYYSDRTEDGRVDVTLNTSFHHLQNTEVRMEFQKDGVTKHTKEAVTDALGKTSFTFPLSWIQEKKTKYTIVCSVEGETVSQNVYIYDRPKYIRKDGIYEENGKVFDPVPIYHVTQTDALDTLKGAGINLVQTGITTAWLAALEQRDMKAIAVLYKDKTSAGASARIEETKQIVRNYKKRSGIFGWAVQDEPDIKPQTLAELETAYVTIRQYDDNHPVWITANADFETLAKYCDVLCGDSYPIKNTLFTTRTAESIRQAVNAANGKPVYSLLQAFAYNESQPNADQLRHMVYQSFYAGAKGAGYYCYEKPIGTADLPQTTLWTAVQTFGREKETAFRVFVHTTGETLLKAEDANAAWLVKRVDGDVFLLVLNKSYQNGLQKIVSHPVFAAGMQAVSADGTKAGNVTVGNGSVTVTLEKNGAQLIRLVSADTAIRLVTEEGEPVSALSEGDSVRPYACVWQKDAANPALMLAVYSGNRLVGLSVYSGQATTTAPYLTVGEAETAEKGLTYKLLLWDKRSGKPIDKKVFTT